MTNILAAAPNTPTSTSSISPEESAGISEDLRNLLARANTPSRPNVRSNIRTVETSSPIINTEQIAQQRDKIINYNHRFYIKYTYFNTNGDLLDRYFNFSLLPAIESTLQYSASGNFRGNAGVPDTRPGIPIRTSVKHRNITCPGGTTVIQTIGIESKYITLVGAFIGSEGITTSPNSKNSLDPIYYLGKKDDIVSSATTSYKKALLFDNEVVQQGKEVTLFIDTVDLNNKIYKLSLTGVINEFRLQTVRRFKSYYSINMIITDFQHLN